MYKKLLYLLIILFCSYFIFLSFSRHDNFYSRRLDLGNMDQTVWNVANGNGFTLTDPYGENQESRLAVHADFLLIFLAPLYYIWSDPRMLLLVQTIVLGMGALPVYWLARDKLKSEKPAILFSAAFLLYPTIQRNLLHDFHAVALSTTFLLFAYWYMHKNQFGKFTLFALLAALGKEDVWLVTGLMGLYLVLVRKKILFGALVSLISFAVFILLFWVFIPSVTVEQKHFALGYLSDFGTDLNSILINLVTNPLKVLLVLTAPDRLYYYFQLLIPMGFMSLFSPEVLIFGIPALIVNVLSNNHLMRMIDYQYTGIVTPFIFISAVIGYDRVNQKIKSIRNKMLRKYGGKALAIIVSAMVAGSSVGWGELPFGLQSRFKYFTTPQAEKRVMEKAVKNISSKYSVSVTNNIGARVSQREKLYNFPIYSDKADYVFVQLGDMYAWPSREEQQNALSALLQNSSYKLIIQQGNFYAFRKKEL